MTYKYHIHIRTKQICNFEGYDRVEVEYKIAFISTDFGIWAVKFYLWVIVFLFF